MFTNRRLIVWWLVLGCVGIGGLWAVWRIVLETETAIQPALVFNWHGGRAGLDERGAGGPPLGLEDLVAAGVSHVGVPQHNPGDFGHRNYITQLRDLDIRIVRTMERRWNAGVDGKDLGAIILAWESLENPGPFFEAYRRNLLAPCDGIAWNMEHDILNPAHYPVSAADKELAALWELEWVNPQEAAYVVFRCRQFALLFQMYFAVARRQFPGCNVAIGYSGYGGLPHSGRSLQQAYGCDWEMLGTPLVWRDQRLEPITHAMCAWHPTVALPDSALPPPHGLPLLHNIQLAPQLNKVMDNYRAQVCDRLKRLRPGDGFGLVEYGLRPVWDEEDRTMHQMFGQVMADWRGAGKCAAVDQVTAKN